MIPENPAGIVVDVDNLVIDDDNVEFLGVNLNSSVSFEVKRAGYSLPITRVMSCEKWLYESLLSSCSTMEEMSAKWNSIVQIEQLKPFAQRRKIFPKTTGLLKLYATERKQEKNVRETISQICIETGEEIKARAEKATKDLREQGKSTTFSPVHKLQVKTRIPDASPTVTSNISAIKTVAVKGSERCRRCGRCRGIYKDFHSAEKVKSTTKEYCMMPIAIEKWEPRPGYSVDDERKTEHRNVTKKWWKDVKHTQKIDERDHWNEEWWSVYEYELDKTNE